MSNCIFCKIVKGEIPSNKLFEDEKTLAFLDINPISKGHTLVISKNHYSDFLETPLEELQAINSTIQKIGKALKSSLGADALNIGFNIGKEAGQIIFHVHAHVIPRYSGDGLKKWSRKLEEKPNFEEIAKLVSNQL